jgi:hypothetical protein
MAGGSVSSGSAVTQGRSLFRGLLPLCGTRPSSLIWIALWGVTRRPSVSTEVRLRPSWARMVPSSRNLDFLSVSAYRGLDHLSPHAPPRWRCLNVRLNLDDPALKGTFLGARSR